MGTLFGFAVGYVVGARASREGLREVVKAAQTVAESEEFRGLLSALREHAKHVAHAVGDWAGGEGGGPSLDDLLAEARARLGR